MMYVVSNEYGKFEGFVTSKKETAAFDQYSSVKALTKATSNPEVVYLIFEEKGYHDEFVNIGYTTSKDEAYAYLRKYSDRNIYVTELHHAVDPEEEDHNDSEDFLMEDDAV